MSDPTEERDDRLAAALKESLAARDRAQRAPLFNESWPSAGPAAQGRWRLRWATLATLAVVGILLWTGLDQGGMQRQAAAPATYGRIDPALAHQLSSTDYWRVPTDGLLAYAAPPLSAGLPPSTDLELSLEESLL